MRTINNYSALSVLLIIMQNMYGMSNDTVIIGTVSNPNFSNPVIIAINPITGATAYVGNNNYSGNLAISIINVAANEVIGNVTDPYDHLLRPSFLAFAPNGLIVYSVNQAGTVTVIDATDNAVIQNVTTLSGYPFAEPNSVVFSADSTTAYIANGSANYISVIDVETSAEIDTISLSSIPSLGGSFAIALSPDGTQLYVCPYFSSHLVAVNLVTKVATQISISYPSYIAFDPISSAHKAYIIDSVGISIVDTANNSVVGTIAYVLTESSAIVFTPDGSTAYIVNSDHSVIQIIDVASDTIIGSVDDPYSALDEPFGLALTPNGLKGYIPNIGNSTVSIMITTIPTPPISILPPASVSGCKMQNRFFLQTDFINNITWTSPTTGTAPSSYNIYRDAYLTDLAATIPASSTLQYYDHNRNPNITYSYYITSVDSGGNPSTAASVTVTNPC